jgi:uncharacterized delta-60 repeat protein
MALFARRIIDLRSTNIAIASLFAIYLSVYCALPVHAVPGNIDHTFGVNGWTLPVNGYSTSNPTVQSGGAFVLGGSCVINGQGQFCLARYKANGDLDTTFGNDGVASTTIGFSSAIVETLAQPDGKVLAVGRCKTSTQSVNYLCAARYLNNGALDSLFANGGVLLNTVDQFSLSGAASTADGSVLAAGRCATSNCVSRYTNAGVLDINFGSAGRVTLSQPLNASSPRVLLQGDRVLLTFDSCFVPVRFVGCLLRLNAEGTADNTFGAFGEAYVGLGANDSLGYRSLLLPDLSIVLTAQCGNGRGWDFCLAKLTPTGTLDPSFGVEGKVVVTGGTHAVSRPDGIVLADDKILVSGSCYELPATTSTFCSARFLANGAADTTYGLNSHRVVLPYAATGSRLLTGILAQGSKYVAFGWCDGSVPANLPASFCATRLKGGPYPASACTLNADANNTIAASSDAMLVTRYLLGFRGDGLTAGAIGQGATRTADEIVAYLETLKNDPLRKLDLDGDGQSLATTDGLLMLRAMLGLSGDALTTGAMGQTSAAFPTLRTSQQILQWIESTHGVACLP